MPAGGIRRVDDRDERRNEGNGRNERLIRRHNRSDESNEDMDARPTRPVNVGERYRSARLANNVNNTNGLFGGMSGYFTMFLTSSYACFSQMAALVFPDRLSWFFANRHPNDLSNAAQLSNIEINNAVIMQKQGIFSLPVSKQNQDAVEIPKAYICPIRLEIMLNPVLCTLDGQSYEALAIKDWLIINRTSPLTRDAMGRDQFVDDVLIPNRNLKEAIELFRNNNPQLFPEADLRPHCHGNVKVTNFI
jgi:hypothetical protein